MRTATRVIKKKTRKESKPLTAEENAIVRYAEAQNAWVDRLLAKLKAAKAAQPKA